MTKYPQIIELGAEVISRQEWIKGYQGLNRKANAAFRKAVTKDQNDTRRLRSLFDDLDEHERQNLAPDLIVKMTQVLGRIEFR